MKARFLVLGALLAAFAVAQQAYRFERKYVQGEKDVYDFKLSFEIPQGSVNLSMAQTATVTKVHENGDADIETESRGLKALLNGQEMPIPGAQANSKTTTRFTKYGAPVSSGAPGAAGPRRGMGQNIAFAQFAAMTGEKPITVGETVQIDYVDPNDPKITAKGPVKLESVDAGIARLVSNLAITNSQTTVKPMKLTGTILVETATSKLKRAEGTVSDIPSRGGFSPQTCQFTMERKAG